MILYNRNGWNHIEENSYIFQECSQFADYLYNNKMFFTEENIVSLVTQKLKNEDLQNSVFIDIGANVGAYTLQLANLFSHTYSFEPVLDTYNILCGNIAINNLSDKTTLINAGLGAADKEMVMHEYDVLGSLTHITEEDTDFLNENMKKRGFNVVSKKIKICTLDHFNIKNVKLIKIDVEGNELEVLKGSKNTLIQSNYPMLIVESWSINDNDEEELKEYKRNLRTELFSYIKNLDYNINSTENPEVFICEHVNKVQKNKVKSIFY